VAAGNLADVTAAILAGGLGTRLRPAVGSRSKVLAPVHDRPFVTYLLDQLARAGVREVVLLTGYRAEQVQHTLGESYAGMSLVYSPELSLLGTAGAVRRAIPILSSRAVLLMNGDSFCDVDLVAFKAFHRRHIADLSLVLTQTADTSRYGKVRFTNSGRVLRFDEKKQEGGPGWINAGVYLIARDLIEEIPCRPDGQAVSLERDMMPAWISRGRRVFGFPCNGRFLDIGTPVSYAEAETFFRP
jgi:NDP-sugar pyrophosphorylase family protein